MRRIEFHGDTSLNGVAAQHGCSLAAVVRLFPFFVDDDFLTLLTSAARPVRSADLIGALQASSVRRPRSEEILLSLQLGQRHTVYIDDELLAEDEVIFCLEPPTVWITTTPSRLCAQLQARPIVLPTHSTSRRRG